MPSSKSATKPAFKPVWEWSFDAIGTGWWIGIYHTAGVDTAVLQQKITRLIDDFDQTYSRFRADSLVTKMSQKAGTYTLPSTATPLLTLYKQLYDLTGGAVTPLIGQLLSDTGYDATYSLQPKKRLQAVPEWDDVLQIKNTNITLKTPTLLDFGAAGKGYLVDLVSELLKTEGITQFCVDAGGDMYAYGLPEPLTVGLENPDDLTEAIGVATVQNQALCGSAPNRRSWGEYHHIMNPASNTSTTDLEAVWVTANSTMLADGLTTALFFTEPQQLQKQFIFEYALVYADGSLRYSTGFAATFFS